jgi:hypothetical protein
VKAYKGQGTRGKDIRRRSIRRRGIEIPDRSNSNIGRTTDNLQHTEAGNCDTIIVGSRIHSSLRSSEGCQLDETTPTRISDDRNTNKTYRQRISIKSSQYTSLASTETAYRASIPLSPTRSQQRPCQD